MEKEIYVISKKYPKIDFHLLAFKYPSTFDKKLIKATLSVFVNHSIKKKLYLTEEELINNNENIITPKYRYDKYKQYINTISWYKTENSKNDALKKISVETKKLIDDNIKILIKENIIRTVPCVRIKDDTLKVKKKYYLRQLDTNLENNIIDNAKKTIKELVIKKIEDYNYPDSNILSIKETLSNMPDYYPWLNNLIHLLILSGELAKVPLLEKINNKERYNDYLILGKVSENIMKAFSSNKLIPYLKYRFPQISKNLTALFNKYEFKILEDEIIYSNSQRVYFLCFIILEAKKHGKQISLDDFNLANLILNIWLSLEKDPFLALKRFSILELDNDFLNPIITNYLEDPSLLKNNFNIIKGFIHNLPQLIVKEELIYFFKSKGLQRKFVDDFINTIPNEVMLIHSLNNTYLIAKSQLINAIIYLYNGNFYNKTKLGKEQFDVLSKAFYILESKAKDVKQVFLELKAKEEDYNKVKSILSKSKVYKMLIKRKERGTKKSKYNGIVVHDSKEYSSRLPDKKIYTLNDFKGIEKEQRSRAVSSLGLLKIELTDSKKNIHHMFIKQSQLNIDDVKFLKGNPSYELFCKQFEIL